MSYILNALRKSEQERQAMQPETVADRILIQQPKVRRDTPKWVVIAILGNALIIAGIFWFSQKQSVPPETRQSPSNTRFEKTDVRPIDKPAQEIKASSKSKAMNSAPGLSSLADQVDEKPLFGNQTSPPGHGYKKPLPVPMLQAHAEIKKPLLSKTITPPLSVKQSVRRNSVSATAGEMKTVPEKIVTHKIPFLSELPYEFRQSVPKMTINVFVYSSEPAERFVMINMIKYKAGQQTVDLVDIKEIRPDSLIASFNNQTFQLGRP